MVSLTHSIRVRTGRLQGRAILQWIRFPGDDDLKKTRRLLHAYLVFRPAGDRPVVHVVGRCIIQPGAVPVAGDQAERLHLRESAGRDVHQLPGIVERPVESDRRRFRLYATHQGNRLVLQGADNLSGRTVLADGRV